MNTQNILNANILDILFDGRNKAYGAYDLRKNYNKRLVKALAATLGICFLFTMGSIFANGKKGETKPMNTIEVSLDDYKDKKKDELEIPKEQPKPEPQKQFERIAVNIPVIAPNHEVDDKNEVKPVEATEDVKIGASSIVGEKGGDDIISAPVNHSVTGDGDGKLKVDNTDNTEIFKTVEIPAQFPGGFEAWKKYLERNLNASLPAENGAQSGKYTVMVSFVVDKEGNISDVKAENAPGFGTEAEAIKIITKGPKWQPAIQNGRKVAYRARQQVTFLVDDNG
ncbi:MAG: energy transducer TonB [Flavobacterium sp.]|nr:energy transducer TonB [Flavobacterium sp.]